MKSYEVLKRVVESVGTKQVAHDLGVSASLVYKWCALPAKELGDDGSGVRNPLDRLIGLVESTGDRSPAEWLCAQVGGCFVEDPDLESVAVDADEAISIMSSSARSRHEPSRSFAPASRVFSTQGMRSDGP